MALEPYQKYRPSDVDWIGEIPQHWEIKKIKWLSPVLRGASPRPIADSKYFDENGEFAWVRIADVTASERYLTETTQTLSELGASLSVKRYPGDLFLSIAGSVGKAVITKIKCCIHDGFVYFPYLKMNPEYLYYIFSGNEAYKGLGKLGTQLNLNTETVANIQVPLPKSNLEIESIISFLDRETAVIDTLIAKKQKLIKRLQEKRTALISHTVTKGLDPTAPMKDSGIEWLGQIPAHWETYRLKHISNVAFSNVDKHTKEEEIPVQLCNYVDVYYNDFITDELEFMRATASSGEIQRFGLQQGDVIVTKDSESWDDIAVPAYVPNALENIVCGYHLALIRPNKARVDGRYLFRAFSTFGIDDQFKMNATGVTRFGLGKYDLENSLFLVPPLAEQQAIADFLDQETATFDTLIEKIEQAIDRLHEYRTALISAAVTGKIDVRNHAQEEA